MALSVVEIAKPSNIKRAVIIVVMAIRFWIPAYDAFRPRKSAALDG